MAVLTANTTRPVKAPPGGCKFRILPLAGYTLFFTDGVAHTVYKGSIVVADNSDTPGYYHAPQLIGTTAADVADTIGGIAMEKVEVTSVDAEGLLVDGGRQAAQPGRPVCRRLA